jgi:hypothetical protein
MSQRTFESQFAELGSLLFDAAHTGDIVASLNYTSRICALRKEQLDTANARIAELEAALRDALASCLHDIPEYHEQGMGCGLEDRNITDRYEAMSFGWEQAMERAESEIISNTQEILTAALNPTTGATPCSPL